MGIDVHLESEDGTRLKSILDPRGVIARLVPIDDPKFPLLRYVDMYGNTIFNRAQSQQVLEELGLLERLQNKRTGEEIDVLRQLKELATECGNEPHLYLKFVGD